MLCHIISSIFKYLCCSAGLIGIKNREWKTSILISKKISLTLQRLFSQEESQDVSLVASSTHTNLLQDVYYKSGMEVLQEGHPTLHILVVKSYGSSSKSELVIHKPVISSLLSSSRWFKQSAVSTFYNGGFRYIFSPPNLQVQRVNNLENINLEDTVINTAPITNVSGSVKEANKLKLGGDIFYKHNLPEADLEDTDFNQGEDVFKSHIIAVKACVTSTISGLTMQMSDPSGLLIFEKLKYKAVSSSSVYNGKDSHCHIHDVPEFPVFTTTRVSCVTNTKLRKAKASPYSYIGTYKPHSTLLGRYKAYSYLA